MQWDLICVRTSCSHFFFLHIFLHLDGCFYQIFPHKVLYVFSDLHIFFPLILIISGLFGLMLQIWELGNGFSLCLDRYIVSNEAIGAAKGFLSMICVQISCSFNCKSVKYFALHVITYSSSIKLISVCNFNFIIDISWVYDFISISCNSRSYAILCFGNSGNICSIKVKLIASW